jgi:hypothetical protein
MNGRKPQSSRSKGSTRYPDSVRNVLQRYDAAESVHRRFTFENDLFLAPVYKKTASKTSQALCDYFFRVGFRHFTSLQLFRMKI